MADKFTFKQFQAQYRDDDACLQAIFQRRFGDKPTCPGCGVIGTTFHKITKRRAYACAQCGHHLFPCAGTVFEHSSTPLTLWFHAMYLMTATRNGVSAKELQRQLGVTYKCAWRIGHQLRDLMAARAKAINPGPLEGHIEVDETWVGGKRRRSNKGKPVLENKTPVMGLLQRGGPLKVKVIKDNSALVLVPQVMDNVAPGSTVSTDEWRAYRSLAKLGYNHGAVKHQAEEWKNGIHHTNGIEGFWSHLKRGISSTHVAVSRQHLQRYVEEFAFRYNNREAPAEMFERMLRHVSRG
jgi:predicted RNA-binding Zn-ribbon protein involved in translation (DUF1610 family)/transposase-like protein